MVTQLEALNIDAFALAKCGDGQFSKATAQTALFYAIPMEDKRNRTDGRG
jgi:hypothetical protein